MTKHAIVSGGSIGGLFAATALLRAGWRIDIYERTAEELSGRGAGIVTHEKLINALKNVNADLADLGVHVQDRVAFNRSGQRVATLPYSQIVTSWDRIHQLLRSLIPEGSYHLGRHITSYSQSLTNATAHFSDGSSKTADLLVGADGFRSAIRAQMQPAVKPEFSGYVVWRALAHEADFPKDILNNIFPNFAFYTPEHSQIIGYPIAGPNNDLTVGHRRYNFVWYVKANNLTDMLTDSTGQHHPISIPPPLIRGEIIEDMFKLANTILPNAFIEVLKCSERPFFTPIYDHHSPIMHDGRVALSGDAACVARPHVGMGVTKAAEDALCLAQHAERLGDYSKIRVPASRRAHLAARQLGAWMRKSDNSNKDGSSHKRLSEIMRLTAVTVD